MKRSLSANPLGVLAGVLVLALASGCSRHSPAEPTPLGSLALHVGESLTTHQEAVVTFVEVAGDSRCPSDVTCIWSGNAAVVVTIGVGTELPARHTLNTNLEPHRVDVSGFRVALDSLTPYPVSTGTIEPDEYVAYFTVSRLGGSP